MIGVLGFALLAAVFVLVMHGRNDPGAAPMPFARTGAAILLVIALASAIVVAIVTNHPIVAAGLLVGAAGAVVLAAWPR